MEGGILINNLNSAMYTESEKAISVTEKVYIALRDQIVHMQILPNQLLVVNTLANTMSVSRTAIREALIRLRSEGLVLNGNGNKFQVAPLDQKTILDYFEARSIIESQCVRILTARITKEELQILLKAVENFEDAVQRNDVMLCFKMDHSFHMTLLDLVQNSVITLCMHQSSNMYQRIRVALHNDEKIGDTLVEHREIYNAIAAGDGAIAEQAVLKHIQSTIKNSTGDNVFFKINIS